MYPIIIVPIDAPDLPEQLGSKPKFWFDDNRFLFKEARQDTGEDWAEKIACELCVLLGIPHAHYELAVWKELKGVVSKNFLASEGGLILGNQLLMRMDSGYPGTRLRGVRQHTLRVVLRAVGIMEPPPGFSSFPGVASAVDVFLGYIMFDAWIGNNDRHHQNWGLVFTTDEEIHLRLAPSFDHASSLGRIETDAEKRERLSTKDQNRTVEFYTSRTYSRFYASPSSTKPLTTMDAFLMAAKAAPLAALSWLKRLQDITSEQVEHIFSQIPPERITSDSAAFARRILEINKSRLLDKIGPLLT